ncbi:nitroreductase family protein [Campylobacter sp. MIT 21-1685]|uniref:nitroreductase family protein n=1 Tax=unclassified Campylobacter TaxID=2593542 RepID=UPI00224AC21A|nr:MULTISPECIES: nitroreductase family protein [unclassified Campylobacter]MCX2682393.1 nitroreductase family protein [Campylobacter sp. MIT 21-1684]MCX2750673.1 nitroreductase family protein [Campylobacter sp. MIT 21-1682]MCX2806779.1 nitroreductase family protein [Campylobacter sp. MIT 21-1685]
MDTKLQLFHTRYSCRNFKDEAIAKEDLNEILEVARLSPSSLGLEPWEFLVVQQKNMKEEISLIANNQIQVKNAAALIIIISKLDFAETFEEKIRSRIMSEEEKEKRITMYKPFLEKMNAEQKLAYSREQAHLALGGILYAANFLQIASCTIGGFNKEELDSYLKLDTRKKRSSLLVALGKSADTHIPPKNRQSFDEVVRFI